MPRRPPPTTLVLTPATQPLPPRNQCKHTLPSIPRPTFYQPSSFPRGITSPTRHSPFTPSDDNMSNVLQLGHPQGMQLATPIVSPADSGSMSATGMKLRGPWDHSGSIPLPFDVETLLAPLKPAAISPGY